MSPTSSRFIDFLERVFCPKRSAERARMGPLIQETAQVLGVALEENGKPVRLHDALARCVAGQDVSSDTPVSDLARILGGTTH